MLNYHNFIGIDIGKSTFFTAVDGVKQSKEYNNDSAGIEKFITDHLDILKDSLCVLETTGGYETNVLYTLCQKGFDVHRADTRKVKNFIKSFGNQAKTDRLDAMALARYGFERKDRVKLFKPQSQQALDLFALVQRRSDLRQMLVAEKNRKQSPNNKIVKYSCELMINTIEEQMNEITDKINFLISKDHILAKKREVLKTIPGIGDVVSFELLLLLPELGTIDRKRIASLVGLAPRANESGIFKGYRRVGHGRQGIKPILFMAAMAARNSNSDLRLFYERLIKKGKKKMVALTALKRKILVIANAKLKEVLQSVAL